MFNKKAFRITISGAFGEVWENEINKVTLGTNFSTLGTNPLFGGTSFPSEIVVQQVGTDRRQNVLLPCVRQLDAFHAWINAKWNFSSRRWYSKWFFIERGVRNMSPMEKLMVTMCLIYILIARIKSNILKFRNANEQEAELGFSLPIELSNVCWGKQTEHHRSKYYPKVL